MATFRMSFAPLFATSTTSDHHNPLVRRQMDGHYNPRFWAHPAMGQKAADIGQLFVYVSIGFFFYEQILSAKFDYQTLFGTKRKLRGVHVAYFGTKLSMYVYTILSLIFFWRETEINCQQMFYALETIMGLVTFFSSTLLAFRTYCVYQGREQRIVLALLAVFSVGLLAAWMQGVEDVKSVWHPIDDVAQYKHGYCLYTGISETYWVKYLVTICFDAVILFMTTFGIARMAGRSSLGVKLINQGIIFFVMTFIANLTISVITLLRLSPSMSLVFAFPQSTICVLCSCRLHRNLASENKDHVPSTDFSNRNIVNSPPPSSRFAKLPLIGRYLQHDMAAVEPLSYSQGTVPTFVSTTTYAPKGGSGLDTPMYAVSIPAYTPGNDDLENQRGYFDITPAATTAVPSTQAVNAVQRIESRQQLALEDMLREGPPFAGGRANPNKSPKTTGGVHMQIEQNIKIEEEDTTK